MRRRTGRRVAGVALGGLLFLGTFMLLAEAWAEEPMVVIRLVAGGSATYAASEIERIGFEGEETLVVVTAGGSYPYATESIARIDFLWEPTGVEGPADAAPLIDAIHLFQNQPNPFSPQTRIGFEVPEAGRVEVGIYSVQGRLIRTLVDRELATGPHEVVWDGQDQAGKKVPGGVYFYSLRGPGIEESRRMILLR